MQAYPGEYKLDATERANVLRLVEQLASLGHSPSSFLMSAINAEETLRRLAPTGKIPEISQALKEYPVEDTGVGLMNAVDLVYSPTLLERLRQLRYAVAPARGRIGPRFPDEKPGRMQFVNSNGKPLDAKENAAATVRFHFAMKARLARLPDKGWQVDARESLTALSDAIALPPGKLGKQTLTRRHFDLRDAALLKLLEVILRSASSKSGDPQDVARRLLPSNPLWANPDGTPVPWEVEWRESRIRELAEHIKLMLREPRASIRVHAALWLGQIERRPPAQAMKRAQALRKLQQRTARNSKE